MQEDYIRFDRTKLKAVVHFICDRCDPTELGNVKLHKILYFADMMKYAGSGEPLTGVDYVKQQFGPVARHLSAVLTELTTEKKREIESKDYFGFEKKQYTSISDPELSLFSNLDIQLLIDVIEFVCGRSAKAISELSHDIAWKTAYMGERIPYAAALAMQPVEITDEDIACAADEAKRIWPMIEAEHRASSLI